jgi:hypothetical protein
MAWRMSLERLVYVSTATAPVISPWDVSDILTASLILNRANDITGALAFTDIRFVQMLEGRTDALDGLIAKLIADYRHRDLVFIDRVRITERAFGRWSMVSPPFTKTGKQRLAEYLTQESRPMWDFQQLLLDMVAERD